MQPHGAILDNGIVSFSHSARHRVASKMQQNSIISSANVVVLMNKMVKHHLK